MRKTKLALAVAAASLVSTSAFATNGTNMVGLGAKSAALGGTGVAAYYGAENVVINPGLIGKETGTEFSFGGTLFKPDVKNESNMTVIDPNNGPMNGAPMTMSGSSDADTFLVPTVSIANRIDDNWVFGVGMYGSSGMGVDYDFGDFGGMATNNVTAQSNLQIMRFVPTIAYNQDNFGVGFSPIIQYGSLDIAYNMPDGTMSGSQISAKNKFGTGVADDLGMGFSLGGYFDINEDLTLAASYTSGIEMEYKGQISSAAAQMGLTGFSDKLEQPAELKLGAAYKMGKMTYTADFKQIKWGDAKGYKDFGWEDQNVIMLGFKYTDNDFWAGLGYNQADDPIKKQNIMTNPNGASINMFNNMFFPAITTSHITFGGGYNLSKNVGIDGAIVYAPEEKKTVNTGMPVDVSNNIMAMGTNTTKHSQMAYTVTVRYNF